MPQPSLPIPPPYGLSISELDDWEEREALRCELVRREQQYRRWVALSSMIPFAFAAAVFAVIGFVIWAFN